MTAILLKPVLSLLLFLKMNNENTIRQTVYAEPGSKLERVVFQILNDMETNMKRIKEDFDKKIEKQQKKIERRL